MLKDIYDLSPVDKSIPNRLKGRWMRYEAKYEESSGNQLDKEKMEQHNPITFSENDDIELSSHPKDTDQDSASDAKIGEKHPMGTSRVSSSRLEHLNQQFKADMRKRFTRALKTKFWSLINDGYLSPSRGFYLLLLTDFMLDDDMENTEISSFKYAKSMLDKSLVRILVQLVFEMTRNFSWTRGLARKIEHAAVSTLYECSSAFILAHKNAEALLKSHLQLNESYDQDMFVKVVDEIVAESTINIKKMRDYFEEFRAYRVLSNL